MTTDATKAEATSADADWHAYPDLDIPPILAAALEHFQQRGYHGTSVRSIAAGVGLTMPTLYYHYGNKEGILHALLEIAMDDLQMHIDSSLQDAGDDTFKQFVNLITSVGLHQTHRRDLAMLHDEFRFLGTDMRSRYVTRRTVVESTLEGVLTQGMKEGIFADEDPHFTARLLLGMVRSILDWYHEGGPLSAAEIASRYAERAVRIVTPAALT